MKTAKIKAVIKPNDNYATIASLATLINYNLLQQIDTNLFIWKV